MIAYRPGTSPVHRIPAGAKLLALAVLGLALGAGGAHWPVLVGGALLLIVGTLVARVGLRTLATQLWQLRFLLIVTVVFQLLFLPPLTVLTTTVRIVEVILLAGLIVLTTPTSRLIAAIERGLSPLRRVGVDVEQLSLLLALGLRTIPTIGGYAREIRDAHRARGVTTRLTSQLVPLLVLSFRRADDVADALVARGLADP